MNTAAQSRADYCFYLHGYAEGVRFSSHPQTACGQKKHTEAEPQRLKSVGEIKQVHLLREKPARCRDRQ